MSPARITVAGDPANPHQTPPEGTVDACRGQEELASSAGKWPGGALGNDVEVTILDDFDRASQGLPRALETIHFSVEMR